jgi:hypothetical protein
MQNTATRPQHEWIEHAASDRAIPGLRLLALGLNPKRAVQQLTVTSYTTYPLVFGYGRRVAIGLASTRSCPYAAPMR